MKKLHALNFNTLFSMSLLDRLEIRGIRSYGPERDDAQIIKFLTPLTLVLGDNGCGKTTIIEALKFATSGGLPSGSRMGHNFVYYPKLENLPEVVGSVKLRFHDVHNHDVTVHKLAKRQLSGATNKFARVDSTLTRVDENGKHYSPPNQNLIISIFFVKFIIPTIIK